MSKAPSTPNPGSSLVSKRTSDGAVCDAEALAEEEEVAEEEEEEEREEVIVVGAKKVDTMVLPLEVKDVVRGTEVVKVVFCDCTVASKHAAPQIRKANTFISGSTMKG
jgi:hypothetical protein